MRLSLSSISSEREAHRAGRRPGRAALTSKCSQRVRRDQRRDGGNMPSKPQGRGTALCAVGGTWVPPHYRQGAWQGDPAPNARERSERPQPKARTRGSRGQVPRAEKGGGVRGGSAPAVSASFARLACVLGSRVSGLFGFFIIPASRFYRQGVSIAFYGFGCPFAGARSGAFVERRVYERR